jgi:uncharacterized membrane protein YoaK (UPF0700 family)
MLKMLAHPRWVIVAGCALAFLGSAVNAYYLIELGTSVSHLTGDVSKVAMTAAEGRHSITAAALQLIAATLGFLLGAAGAGFFIHHPSVELTRPYGRGVLFIGFCLLAAHFSLQVSTLLSILFASFGCGFQNALATHYRGMILRTTHITGLLTDFGTHLGMKLRGYQIPSWKLIVPGLLVLSFFLGATLGSYVVLSLHRPILLPVALIYLGGGLMVTFIKHVYLRDALPKS